MAKSYMKLDGNLVPVSVSAVDTGQKEEQTKTVSSPDFSSGNVVVTPDTGKVMTKVTVVKDNDLVPENIVKDKNIFGVVGTAETGGGGGGYTVTFKFYFNFTLTDIHIIQANGNEFQMAILCDNHSFGKEVVFEDVTYIKWTPSHYSLGYDGITEAQLIAGKTLTNDIRINVHDD